MEAALFSGRLATLSLLATSLGVKWVYSRSCGGRLMGLLIGCHIADAIITKTLTCEAVRPPSS